jgi:hypothetical protein
MGMHKKATKYTDDRWTYLDQADDDTLNFLVRVIEFGVLLPP